MHVHYASFDNVTEMNRAYTQIKSWATRHIAGNRHRLATRNLKTKPNQVGTYTGNNGEYIATMHVVNAHYNAWHCMGKGSLEPDGNSRIMFHAAIRQFLYSDKGSLFAVLRCHRSLTKDNSDHIGSELSEIGAHEKIVTRVPDSDANLYEHPGFIADTEPLLIIVPCPSGEEPDPESMRIAQAMHDMASIAVVEHAAMLSIARRIENPQAQHIWVTRPLIIRIDSPVTAGNYSIGELPMDVDSCRKFLMAKQNEIATDIMYSSTFFALKMAWDDAQLLCHTAPGKPESIRGMENERIRELERQIENAEQKLKTTSDQLAQMKQHAEETRKPPKPESTRQVTGNRQNYEHVTSTPEFDENVGELLDVETAQLVMDAMENLGRALQNTPQGRIGNYANYFNRLHTWSLTPPQSPASPDPQEFQITEHRPNGPVTITAIRRMSGEISLLNISAT